jgi:hypothetical protein
MVSTRRGFGILGGRLAFAVAVLAAFWIGGCGHDHHEDDHGSSAAWHDNSRYQQDHYRGDVRDGDSRDHEYNRDR